MVTIEQRKMFVGPIENDEIMEVKIGERLIITNDENIKGKKGTVTVKNCHDFSQKLLEYDSFFF